MRRLLLATNNPGKVAELRALLADCGWELLTPEEAACQIAPEEAGASYAENARIKAAAFAAASGYHALADDSGLEVDALGGAPGVRSARYAGVDISDRGRVHYLLQGLRGVAEKERTARFRCLVALASPEGKAELFEGVCEGSIALGPAGERGFGYDPIFRPEGSDRTMAELSPDEKNRISHRARAIAKASRYLLELARAQRGAPQ